MSIGGTEQISYIDMMATVASELHLKRKFISVPFMTVGLSRFWVSLVTGFPRELVAPLIKSLRTPMLVGNQNLFNLYGIVPLDFRSCVRSGLKLRPGHDVFGKKKVFSREHFWACVSRLLGRDSRHESSLVCSMQRLALPAGCDVRWVAKEYGAWLVKFLYPFIRVETSATGDFDFSIRPLVVLGPRMHILRLRYEPARSSDTRQLYYITGGLLLGADAPQSGRLEFRQLPGGREIMATIFNFKPSLPWWIYKFTQAIAHLWVMKNFSMHLRSIKRS
ncbi:MAG: hypothetical protein NTV34_15465 [Proteobacteria bacterium]|nr:hypothetical protein [Pseudomonadota bacterium]